MFYDVSIEEMRDADTLIKRILMYDGHPNLQRLNSMATGEDPEEIIRLAADSEKAAIIQFATSAKRCREMGEPGTAAVFEHMVLEEEGHADYFEGQLDAIARVGIQGYLAQQIEADSGPE